MAVALVTFTPAPSLGGSGDIGQRTVAYYGTLAIQPNPATYATGGLTTLLTPTNPLLQLGSAGQPAIFTDRTPLGAWVQSQTNSGYTYIYNTTTKKLLIMQNGGAAAPGGEIPVAAIPAAVSADVIFYNFVFPRV
jgi:hypothetical protein